MGFGHRVYKNFDPRATIIREMCHKVLADLNVNDPLLDVAMELEEAALKDPYFVERKLYPNVDFYSGIIYKALKIPTEMFTVMFAIARTAGWVAHWLEQHLDPETQDRSSAPDLYRRCAARLRGNRQTLSGIRYSAEAGPPMPAPRQTQSRPGFARAGIRHLGARSIRNWVQAFAGTTSVFPNP